MSAALQPPCSGCGRPWFQGHDVGCPDRYGNRLRTQPQAKPTPDRFAAGMQGSHQAATKWTAEEARLIDNAIVRTAMDLAEFTADDVWARAPGVRVTKGMAGRLNAARNRGIIAPTGFTGFSQKGGEHDHGQRLAIWKSLIYKAKEAS